MLDVISYWWGDKYDIEYVQKLVAGLKRNIKQPYRFSLITDKNIFSDSNINRVVYIPKADTTLIDKGCFVRLRMFDPNWQSKLGFNDRIVCIDLDSVICGPLDDLFDRPEPFVIMSGGNSSNPNPFGGALQMLKAGMFPEVWNDFSLEAASKVPYASFPDDQAWLHAKIPNAATWQVGSKTGVYCFKKPGWPPGTDIAYGTKIVTFRGNNPPSKYTHLYWVRENWVL